MSAERFSTHILDRAIEEQRRGAELLRLATRAVLDRALADAPSLPHEVVVFGSVERQGHLGLDSDVDVAIGALEPRDYFVLKSHLEQRLRREVDLVDLDNCHFAASIRRHGTRWNRPDS